MSEIEKLYELAGVEPYRSCNSCIDDNGNKITNSKNCSFRNLCGNACDVPHYIFTAKKQIELIKWLALRDYITIVAYIGGIYSSEHDKYNVSECSLESCLARLINNLWQGLTKKEKQQIKEILQ